MNKKIYIILVILCLMISCSSDKEKDKGELRIYNFTDYTSPKLLEKFEKETGIKVILDSFDSNELLLSKLQSGSGGYDIIVASQNFIPIMIQQDLLYEFDAKNKLKNFDNIEDKWKDPSFDKGNLYTIPFAYGSTGFAIDKNILKTYTNSYETLFKPSEVVKGKIGMFSSPSDVIDLALIYLGRELCSEDSQDFKDVLDLLIKQKPYVHSYNSDGVLERIVSGETIIQMNYNGYSMKAREQRESVHWIHPKEGILVFMDSLAIPKQAPNKENAIKFLDFFLQPENGALEAEYAGYPVAIKNAEKYYSRNLKNGNEVKFPDDIKTIMAPVCSKKSSDFYSKTWEKLKK